MNKTLLNDSDEVSSRIFQRMELKSSNERVHVLVYRIKNLIDFSKIKLQIVTKASKLHMSGVVAVFCDCCLIIIEGSPKQQCQFQNFIINNTNNLNLNACKLVMQTKKQRRNFGKIRIKVFLLERKAQHFFRSYECEQYLELIRSEI